MDANSPPSNERKRLWLPDATWISDGAEQRKEHLDRYVNRTASDSTTDAEVNVSAVKLLCRCLACWGWNDMFPPTNHCCVFPIDFPYLLCVVSTGRYYHLRNQIRWVRWCLCPPTVTATTFIAVRIFCVRTHCLHRLWSEVCSTYRLYTQDFPSIWYISYRYCFYNISSYKYISLLFIAKKAAFHSSLLLIYIEHRSNTQCFTFIDIYIVYT